MHAERRIIQDMSKPEVSVIIVNLNTRDLLRQCLSSVVADRSVMDKEIIVVDNGSSDDSVPMVRREFPLVLLQVNTWNQRFAQPNNDGMKIAKGDFLFFLNSDAVINEGTLGALRDFLKAHPQAGACGPLLEYPDGRLQRSVSKFHSPWTHICDMLFLDALLPHTRLFGGGEMMNCPYDPSRSQVVESIMGAAFMVRRQVIDRTGMFDEKLTVFYNEMDWFRRMRDDGWQVWYAPVTKVQHYRGVTSESMNRGYHYLGEMYFNVFHYFRKYYGTLGVWTYRFWLVVGFSIRWALWRTRALLDHSPKTKSSVEYVTRVLAIALRFWIPIEAYEPKMPDNLAEAAEEERSRGQNKER